VVLRDTIIEPELIEKTRLIAPPPGGVAGVVGIRLA
jgi:hypothetical protein